MLLRNGHRYRGSIIVDSGGLPVPKSTIQSRFSDIGFGSISIWSDPDELPEEWPAEDREEADIFLESQFWAEGVWALPDTEPIMKGTGWSILWIRDIGSEEVVVGDKEIVGGASYSWIVPTAMFGMFAMVTALHVKGSK